MTDIIRFLLNQGFSFTYFLGPWLAMFCGIMLACGAIEMAIHKFKKPVILVKIVGDDDYY